MLTVLPYLVLKAHEAVAMIVSQRRLGRVSSDRVSRVTIRETLDRECWSCRQMTV